MFTRTIVNKVSCTRKHTVCGDDIGAVYTDIYECTIDITVPDEEALIRFSFPSGVFVVYKLDILIEFVLSSSKRKFFILINGYCISPTDILNTIFDWDSRLLTGKVVGCYKYNYTPSAGLRYEPKETAK